MSLINDALKRAQQEREKQTPKRGLMQSDVQPATPDSAMKGSPTQPQFGGAHPIGKPQGMPVLTLVFGLIIGGSALAAAISFGVFLYFQMDDPVVPESSSPITPQEVRLSPESITSPDSESGAGSVTDANPTPIQLSNQSAVNRPIDLAEVEPPSLASDPEPEPGAVAKPAPVEVIAEAAPAVIVATEPDPEIEALREELAALRNELASVQATQEAGPSLDSSEIEINDDVSGSLTPATVDAMDPGLAGSDKAPVSAAISEPSPPSNSALPTVATEGGIPAVEAYVSQASVTGIRLSGASPKVVLNNRVYRLNESVLDSGGIPIRIVEISRDRLTFEDQNGFKYIKRF